MLRLRPYKPSDAAFLQKWIPDERADFIKWCAGKFTYPIQTEQLEQYYHLIEDEPGAWSMTALDESGMPVGHFLMRFADYEKESIHLGFILLDPSIRGKGYGKEMLRLTKKFAFDILGMKRVTLCVFDNNPAAHQCYLAAGFADDGMTEKPFDYDGEKWLVRKMAAIQLDK